MTRIKNIPLICPGCGFKLYKNKSLYLCKNLICCHSASDKGFKELHGIQVLIRDELCDTACGPKDIWSITRSALIARLVGVVCEFILRPFSYLVSPSSMYDASSGVYFFGYKSVSPKLKHRDLIKLYKVDLD